MGRYFPKQGVEYLSNLTYTINPSTASSGDLKAMLHPISNNDEAYCGELQKKKLVTCSNKRLLTTPHLQSGVHLEEIEVFLRVYKELDSSCRRVANILSERHGLGAHRSPGLGVQENAGHTQRIIRRLNKSN